MPFFDTPKVNKMNWKKTKLTFGMYKDYTIQKIWEDDAQYLRWLLDNTHTLNLRKSEEERIRAKADLEDIADKKRVEKRLRRFFGKVSYLRGQDYWEYCRFPEYGGQWGK